MTKCSHTDVFEEHYNGWVWNGAWMKLTLDAGEWGNQRALTNTDEPHPVHWRPKQKKKIDWGRIRSYCLAAFKLGYQSSSALGLGLGLEGAASALLFLRSLDSHWTCAVAWISGFLSADLGPSLPSWLYKPIFHYIYYYIYNLPLVVFLWRALMHLLLCLNYFNVHYKSIYLYIFVYKHLNMFKFWLTSQASEICLQLIFFKIKSI